MTLQEILSRLNNVRQSGDNFAARCPAHDDDNNSLSLTEAKDGKILIRCFAGCTFQRIVDALGLKASDFFPRKEKSSRPKNTATVGGVPLEQLAEAKKLPVDFLKELGLKDWKWKGKPAVCIPYLDQNNQVLIYRFRIALDGKGADKFRSRSGERLALYGLDSLTEIRQAGWVLVVEGESDRWTSAYYKIPCLSVPGKNNWKPEWKEFFDGLDVYVYQEPQAEIFSASIAKSLPDIRIIPAQEYKDVSDAHIAGVDLAAYIQSAKASAKRYGEDSPTTKKSQADILVGLAADSGAWLFHTPLSEPFISYPIGDHRENWPVRSKATRRWLTSRFYAATKKAASTEAMQSALNVLEAKAVYEGRTEPVHIRTAWHNHALYYDLADAQWESVRIDGNGWRIVSEPPVRFRRYMHTGAQVEPKEGGNITRLWDFLNVRDGRDRRLIEGWIIAGLIPDIPRPILNLHGDQGSAKSTLCRLLSNLIDPSQAPLLKTKDEADLVQGLAHRFCAILDNVSTLPDWLSDLLCRAVTGEGFTKRQLYTDEDDVM